MSDMSRLSYAIILLLACFDGILLNCSFKLHEISNIIGIREYM